MLANNFQHFNRPGVHDPATVNAMGSDFNNRHLDAWNPNRWTSPTAPIYAVEESQDQVAEMFLGMSIAHRHTDPGVGYNGEDIQCLAGNGIFRMINWIPSPRATSHPSLHEANDIEAALVTATASYPSDRPWTITNPLTGNCVYGVAVNSYDATYQSWLVSGIGFLQNLGMVATGTNQCFDAGANFWLSAVPAAKAADICGSSCGNDATDLISGSQYYNNLFQLAQFGNLDLHTDISFTDDFVTVARNWEIGVVPPRPPHYPRRWRWPPSWMPIPTVNDSWERVRNHSMSRNFYAPHTPLIYRLDKYGTGCGVGFDPKDYNYNRGYTTLLDEAPPCGPHNHGGDYGGEMEWSGTNRLLEPTRRDGLVNSSFNPSKDIWEEYNGLDYMFLFQLYALTETDNYLKKMINPYYTEKFNTDYPDVDKLGSNAYKLTLHYLEYLSAVNTVKPDDNLTFRGAKVIDLLPGFTAEKGSVFEAYVEDYGCGNFEKGQTAFHYATLTDAEGQYFDTPIEYSPDNKGKRGTAQLYHPADDREDHLADSLMTPEIEQAYIDYLQQGLDSLDDGDMSEYRTTKMRGINKPAGDYMMLSPNPNDGNFELKFSTVDSYDVMIYDMLGKQVYRASVVNSDLMRIAELKLAPGNYTVTAMSATRKYIKKMTVQ